MPWAGPQVARPGTEVSISLQFLCLCASGQVSHPKPSSHGHVRPARLGRVPATDTHVPPARPLRGATAFPSPLVRPSLPGHPSQARLPSVGLLRPPFLGTAPAPGHRLRVTLPRHRCPGVMVTAATTAGRPSVPGTARMVTPQPPASGHRVARDTEPGGTEQPAR